MVVIRNIGFSFVFVLIIVSRMFAFPADCGSTRDAMASETTNSIPVQELQNPVSSYLFAIEVSNSAQTITDVHRLGSSIIHPNQLIPLNFDFRRFATYPIPTIYSSSVPIFIRGHSLLN